MTESQPPLQVLGRYELLAPLGQGGMGEVHLARSHGAAGFEKLFIVKTILPRQGKDPQFVERFLHEARVLVHLTHSNIAQVFDMGEAAGQFFMCIEYVAGVDVAALESQAWASGSQIPVPVALLIGQKIAEALGYAHRKTGPDGAPLGIVHRDVSPQNVMVGYEGEVKVIDFGLAKSAARSNRTQSAMVLGKLGYLSPEQARAERVDYRSDVYSCGIVLWELLAGRPLFESGSPGEMLARMANPKLPSLAELRPELSAELIRVVERALAADPAERYARADDLARALNERAIREGLSISEEELGQYVRERCASEFASHRKLISRLSSLTRAAGSLGEVGLEATAIRRAPGPASPIDPVPLEAAPPPVARTAVFGQEPGAQGTEALGAPTPAAGAAANAATSPAPNLDRPAPVAVTAPPAGSRTARRSGLVLGLVVVVVAVLGMLAGARLANTRRRGGSSHAVPTRSAQAAQSPASPASISADARPESARPIPDPAVVPHESDPESGGEPVAVVERPREEAPVTRQRTRAKRPRAQATEPAVVAASGVAPAAAPVSPPAVPVQPQVAAPGSTSPNAAPSLQPPVAPPAAAAFIPQLSAAARLKGDEIVIQNLDETGWTQCEVKLPDNRHASLAKLNPYATRAMALSAFQVEGKKLSVGLDAITIRCQQGTAHLPLGKE